MSSSTYYCEPIFGINEVHHLFDDFFNSFHGRTGDRNSQEKEPVTRTFQPRLDIRESLDNNIITATFELPGLKKEDVKIDVHDNRLVVSGETKFAKESMNNGYVVKERRRGQFSRSVPLPQGIQTDQIKATMEDGVLTVTFPKTSPEQEAKRIIIS